jgi:hypothetical protein
LNAIDQPLQHTESLPSGLLSICTSDDPRVGVDGWFGYEQEAAEAAARWFGARPEDWLDR